uniref:Uncharacterized protein n=1 Tax=Picea sitchensis TaxID=3332 RepID=A9NU55_PICSI|nr:unknown [Picea sitchensis]
MATGILFWGWPLRSTSSPVSHSGCKIVLGLSVTGTTSGSLFEMLGCAGGCWFLSGEFESDSCTISFLFCFYVFELCCLNFCWALCASESFCGLALAS